MLVAVGFPALRRMIVELLDREHGCWAAEPLADQREFRHTLSADPPDLVVLDAADFPRCCHEDLGAFPRWRVVVIGPEPDLAYEDAARRGGAGAWLARDRIGEELSHRMRRALGCSHRPCPPSDAQ